MAANPRGPADPENGWKDPHEAMPMVGDAQSMKWPWLTCLEKHPNLTLMDTHTCFMVIWERITQTFCFE